VPECGIDISVIGSALSARLAAAEAKRVKRDVTRILRRGDRVTGIALDDGSTILVQADDLVVLAAGAGIRPLASTAAVSFPGLRHFASALVAVDAPHEQVPMLLGLFGGPTVVSHRNSLVLGDARRVQLDRPVLTDDTVIDDLAKGVLGSAQRAVGISGRVRLRWAGTKVECTGGDRCQDGALISSALPGLSAAIPGKMTSCLVTADRFAATLVRRWLGHVGRSIWEDELASPEHVAPAGHNVSR